MKPDKPTSIGDILGVPDYSPIHQRTLRHHIEHYDVRLKKWIRKYGPDVSTATYNLGAKSTIDIPGIVFVRHYDPSTDEFTFVDADFDLSKLSIEASRIRDLADAWVKRSARP